MEMSKSARHMMLCAKLHNDYLKNTDELDPVNAINEAVRNLNLLSHYMDDYLTKNRAEHIKSTLLKVASACIQLALEADITLEKCNRADKEGEECMGYQRSDNDDEPIDTCKECVDFIMYEDAKC